MDLGVDSGVADVDGGVDAGVEDTGVDGGSDAGFVFNPPRLPLRLFLRSNIVGNGRPNDLIAVGAFTNTPWEIGVSAGSCGSLPPTPPTQVVSGEGDDGNALILEAEDGSELTALYSAPTGSYGGFVFNPEVTSFAEGSIALRRAPLDGVQYSAMNIGTPPLEGTQLTTPWGRVATDYPRDQSVSATWDPSLDADLVYIEVEVFNDRDLVRREVCVADVSAGRLEVPSELLVPEAARAGVFVAKADTYPLDQGGSVFVYKVSRGAFVFFEPNP
ncbi:MAG: hypothetical protein AAF627_22375 [Myxococcota bacterium]